MASDCFFLSDEEEGYLQVENSEGGEDPHG